MAMRSDDADTVLSQAADDAACTAGDPPPLIDEPRDWRLLYEQERVRAEHERERAEAAEARAEELRWAEVDARSQAGQWKTRHATSQRKLKVIAQKTKKAHHASKHALALQAEVGRLRRLFAELGVDSGDYGPAAPRRKVTDLRREVDRAETRAEAEAAKNRDLHKTLMKERLDLGMVRNELKKSHQLYLQTSRLREQQGRVWELTNECQILRVALKRSSASKESLQARLRRATEAVRSIVPPEEDPRLRKALRRSRRQKATIRHLSGANAKLGRMHARLTRRNERLTRRVKSLKRRLERSMPPEEDRRQLRNTLRRSRLQKAAIKGLSRTNARLERRVESLERRVERQQADLVKLRASRASLSHALHGRKSERQERPRSDLPRGQQRGAAGHGRTPRPKLEKRTEERHPPKAARACACCGQAYAAVGTEQSTLMEIHVKAHKRVVNRSRWRRTCECASSPKEVTAPPAPRLFTHTLYGVSVWSRVLFERYACLRPVQRVSAWLGDQGLPVSPGTLSNSVPRFMPLFEPLAEAILAHQNAGALRHADETTWRVQSLREAGGSGRAWLWTSVGNDAVYFHVDASRSAEVALRLFAGALMYTVIVCDRYSAYKKLARVLEGLVTLAFCWSHQRRDFIAAAAGQPRLAPWCQAWLGRIATLYRLNAARLEHYDPGADHPCLAFNEAQGALAVALDGLFDDAERQLAELPEDAREGRALRSLANHREGLSVFVDRPEVPLDNNVAERVLRGPAIGRGLSFGSDSDTGARFTAMMYSVIGTLTLNGLDVLRWLTAWLQACANNGGRPPDDLTPWLPWSMDEERRRELTAPG